MRIKSVWLLVLKLMGIYLCLGFFETIMIVFSQLINSSTYDFLLIGAYLGGLLFYFAIIYCLLFKTYKLIQWFQLEKDFDTETVNMELSTTSIIRIAVIVLGGLMFIDNVSSLISQLLTFFQQELLFKNYSGAQPLVFAFIKTVIGYLLLTNSSFVTRLIEKQQSK